MDTIQRQATIRRIITDFAFAYSFVNEGHTAPPHVLRWDEVIKDIRKRGVRKSVHVAPTGCFKSSTNNTHAFQYLLGGDKPHCLFATKSPGVRDRTVRLLRELCKDIWDKEGDLWQANKFELPGITYKARDPNFFGASTGKAIEGMRYDLGICDDISDGSSEYSEPAREEVRRWLHRTFILRLNEDEGGRFPCHVWGSFWSEHDILMELIRQGWETHIWPKFGEPCPPELKDMPNVHHHGDEYGNIWPARYGDMTPQQYMDREKMTVQTFNLREQCNPFGAKGRIYDPKWLVMRKPTEEERARMEIWVGDDPRDVGAKGGSEGALVVFGYDPQGIDKNGERGVLHVLDVRAGFWNPAEEEQECLDVMRRYDIQTWTVEKSPISGGHIGWLHNHSPLHSSQINEQTPGGNKDARISSPAPHVRSAKIIFDPDNPEVRATIEQLLAHPGGKMKDRADAWEIGCRPILEGESRPVYLPGFSHR